MKHKCVSLRFAAALSLSAVLLPVAAHAQANSWTNANAGKWEIRSNWSLGVPPTNAQSVFITNAFSKTVTVDATTVLSNALNGCMTVSNLTVAGAADFSFSDRLRLVNSGPGTPLRVLNNCTISNAAGSLLVDSNSVMQVDGRLIDNGFVSIFQGSLFVTNTSTAMLIGNVGTGSVFVVDGEWTAFDVQVGALLGVGTVTFAGGKSTMTAFSLATFGGANGTVLMTGGELIVTNQQLRVGDVGVGQMTVSNGTVRARDIKVGFQLNARGTLTYAGGTNFVSQLLQVGAFNASTGTVVVSGGQLFVTNAADTGSIDIRTGTFTMSGGTVVADRLVATNSRARIFFPAGTMTLRGAEVNTFDAFPVGGAGKTAVLNLVGGTNSFPSGLNVAPAANSTGAVWVTGGQVMTTNFQMFVGVSGIGQMTVSNAAWRASGVNVGYDPGAQGTLTLAGGTNIFASAFEVGIQGGATGAVWMTGGQLIVTNQTTFIGEDGVGRMTVSNGTWQAQGVDVGFGAGSDGGLTVAGGTNVVSSFLRVGTQTGATGAVWVTGGRLITTNSSFTVGNNGIGTMAVSNGVWLADVVGVANPMFSRGTLTIAGGTTTFLGGFDLGTNPSSTGTLWMTAGELVATNSGEARIGSFGIGRLVVSNGTLRLGNAFLGRFAGASGSLTVAGGTTTASSGLTLGNFACTATGIVNVAGGNLFVTNAAGNATLDVRSGTLSLSGGHVEVDTIILTNSCASFSRTGGTLVYSNAVLSTNFAADTDGDGINNAWELAAGLDPLDPADAPLDSDGDGKTNLEEFNTDTDPHDPTDYLHISSIVVTNNNDVLITWPVGTFFGIGIAYRVQSGSNLVTGVTNNLSPFIFGGTASTTNYLDVGGATNVPARFYRIRGLID
jgi:T5SS/PEP-CTERM-associated repeat protein